MITFRQYINESLSNPSKWKWTVKFNNKWVAMAEQINLVMVFNSTGSNSWGTDFRINDRHEITSDGNQFRIFATVLEILEQFISLNSPELLFFTSFKTDSNNVRDTRTSLYKKMITKYVKQIPDYTVRIVDVDDHTSFELRKK